MNPDPNDSYVAERYYDLLYEREDCEEDCEDPDEKYERDRDLKYE